MFTSQMTLFSTCVLLSAAPTASAALAFTYDSGSQTLSITGNGQGTAVPFGPFSAIAEWYEGSTINTEQPGAGDLGLIDIAAGLSGQPATAQVSLRFYRNEADPAGSPVDGFQFFYFNSASLPTDIAFTGNGTPISLAGVDPLVLAALEDAQTPGGTFGSAFNVVDSDSGINSDIDGGFVAVPEPSISLLGILGAGLLLRRRR